MHILKNKKIYISDLFCLLGLMIFSMPGGVSAIFPSYINICLIVVGLMLVFYYFNHYKKFFKNKKLIALMIFFGIYILISSFVNNGDIFRTIKFIYFIVFCSIWSNIYFKIDYWKTISILSIYGKFLLSTNFICSFIYPNGFYIDEIGRQYAFLNNINNMEIFWIPFAAFWLLDTVKKNGNYLLNLLIVFLLVFFPSRLYMCRTGMILSVLLLIFGIVFYYTRIIHIKTSIWLWVSMFLFAMVFIAFKGVELFPIVSNYYTLAQRIDLWEKSVVMALESPLLGYGIGNNDEIVVYNQWRNYSPHNQFLMITLWGGMPLLFSFISIVVSLVGKMIMFNNNRIKIMTLFLILFILYYCLEITFNMGLFSVFLFAIYLMPFSMTKKHLEDGY